MDIVALVSLARILNTAICVYRDDNVGVIWRESRRRYIEKKVRTRARKRARMEIELCFIYNNPPRARVRDFLWKRRELQSLMDYYTFMRHYMFARAFTLIMRNFTDFR